MRATQSLLLALKKEEGDHRQGMQVASLQFGNGESSPTTNCKKLNSANNGKSCKLICTPEPLEKNSVWLTPWFQAYDNKQRTSHTLSEF